MVPEADVAQVPVDPPPRDLLVFELGGALFGVEAARVDAVIPWREPVPLPGAVDLAGVVQDRGRIVTVVRDPRGRRSPAGTGDPPARIIVCATKRGHLGLPASSARAVGTVALRTFEAPGAEVETSEGVLVWVDPDALVLGILGEGEEEGMAR